MAQSVRSHWSRRDLETLFGLQPRAAQNLMAMLPTVAVGTSLLVEREALRSMLDRVHEAGDVTALLEDLRTNKPAAPTRRLRNLVQRDTTPVSLGALPENLQIERGRLEVRFRTLEELARAMYHVARLLEADADAFAAAYEPLPEGWEERLPDGDVRSLFAELRERESSRAGQVRDTQG